MGDVVSFRRNIDSDDVGNQLPGGREVGPFRGVVVEVLKKEFQVEKINKLRPPARQEILDIFGQIADKVINFLARGGVRSQEDFLEKEIYPFVKFFSDKNYLEFSMNLVDIVKGQLSSYKNK